MLPITLQGTKENGHLTKKEWTPDKKREKENEHRIQFMDTSYVEFTGFFKFNNLLIKNYIIFV